MNANPNTKLKIRCTICGNEILLSHIRLERSVYSYCGKPVYKYTCPFCSASGQISEIYLYGQKEK